MMRAAARLWLLAIVLASLLALAAAISAPPVFEHKAERDYKGTNCEVCQAVIKQAIRKLQPMGKPDLSTQKSRRAREQKVGKPPAARGDRVGVECSQHSRTARGANPPVLTSLRCVRSMLPLPLSNA